jgi:enoyl-CoA hydratase/carnithine racemase
MSEARVDVSVTDHVALVTLNRPEKHNALDLAMFEAITATVERLSTAPGLRAVVLHGAGKSFCSGLDFGAVAAAGGLQALSDPLKEEPPNYFQRVAYGWIQVPVPVIAAIHGNCLGGGFQIALGADIRIASPDANLSVMEAKWGLIPDMAITQTLTRLVGIDVAKELTYTSRVFSGEEAFRIGAVTRLHEDPLDEALKLAREIAGRSPDAMRRAKRLFDEGWAGTASETLALEARLQRELIGTPNQIAAVTAEISKQNAEFTDPE